MTKEQISPVKIPFLFSSLIIIAILSFQFYSAKHLRGFWPKFRRLQLAHKLLKPPADPILWPFMSYPMYSYPKYEGGSIKQYSIVGTLSNGQEVKITPENLGINYWIFMYGLKESLRKNKVEDVKDFARLYEEKNKGKLSSIRLISNPLILSKKEINPGLPKIITEVKL